MSESLVMQPIAHIHTDFNDKFGIPRQSGRAESLTGRIVFLPAYRNPDALREITGFSHLWLLFDFSKSHRKTWTPMVRPPRLGGNKRVGVFASRSPFRPNPIGLSAVRLLGVEETENEGMVLVVGGVDLLNMTPIYDIKPYLPFADCLPEAVGGYAEMVQDFRLIVHCSDVLLNKLPQNKRQAVLDCLAEDPRPAYHDEPGRLYSMRFSDYDIHFTVDENHLTVMGIDETK